MLDVIVKRPEWYRGHGPSGSRLLRQLDKQRCCLGFAGRSADVPDIKMLNLAAFSEVATKNSQSVPDSLGKLISFVDFSNSFIGEILMELNDVPVGNFISHLTSVRGREFISYYKLDVHVRILNSEAQREELLTIFGKIADINFSFVD